MLDRWTLITVCMPIKLAKYGLCQLDESSLMIVGGLFVDSGTSSNQPQYSCVNTVYKFDSGSLKWAKLSKLNFRRTLYSTLSLKENSQIFAIGGTVEGINEVYDVRKKKWEPCGNYTEVVGQNDLQTFAVCGLSCYK